MPQSEVEQQKSGFELEHQRRMMALELREQELQVSGAGAEHQASRTTLWFGLPPGSKKNGCLFSACELEAEPFSSCPCPDVRRRVTRGPLTVGLRIWEATSSASHG